MAELTGVNRTALGVASIRAAESRRPDRLFEDAYAAVFAAGFTSPPVEGAALEQRRRLRSHVVLRTRFYDDLLLGSGHRQVVLLGAGLDARAWRLPWPAGSVLLELDQPAVLAYKTERLTGLPGCDRRAVAVDLRDDWTAALGAAGFDPAAPTAWLVEGLLAYLESGQALRLLTMLTSASAAGSVLGCERTGPMRRLAGTVTELWRGGLPDGATAALTDLGWRAEEATTDALAETYGRPDLLGAASDLVRATR